jgi:hypothetical protein
MTEVAMKAPAHDVLVRLPHLRTDVLACVLGHEQLREGARLQ